MKNYTTKKELLLAIDYGTYQIPKKDGYVTTEGMRCSEVEGRNALENMADELKDDRELMFTLAASSGWVIEYASERLKDDAEFVALAVNSDLNLIKYASSRLIDEYSNANNMDFHNQRFIQATICAGNDPLLFASSEQKLNQPFVITALQQGSSLKDVAGEIQDEWEIQLAAVKNSAENLGYISGDVEVYKELVLAAIAAQSGYILDYIPEILENDRDIIRESARYGYSIQPVIDELKKDIAFINECIAINPECVDGVELDFLKASQSA